MNTDRTPKRAGMARRAEPKFIYKNGRRVAVILDIKVYRKMLRQLEDAEDIAYIERRRNRPRDYIPLETYLQKCRAEKPTRPN